MIQKLNDDSEGAAPLKLKARLREATRTAIVDAAEAVYAEHGFEAGRMEQVAQRAGVSVGTLYNYFADRKALVSSLLEDRRAELLRRIDEAMPAAPADPVERLRALLVSSFEHFEAHRPFVSLLVQEGVGECAGPLPVGVSRPSTTIRGLQTRARAALELARDRGDLDDADVDLLAHLFVGSLRAAVLHGLTERDSLEPRAMADRVLLYFIQGTGLVCRP